MVGLSVESVTIQGSERHSILSISSFTADPGEKIGICGPSGAGKSTFLYVLSGLVVPKRGKIFWNGVDLVSLSGSKRDRFKHQFIGLIFQEPCLFEELSALENASLASSFISRSKRRNIQEKAAYYLKRLGVADTSKKVVTFSGGERQRVAVARALAGDPGVILADEPTAALDRENRNLIMDDLVRFTGQDNRTLIMVSHDWEALDRMDRVIEIRDGKIVIDPSWTEEV